MGIAQRECVHLGWRFCWYEDWPSVWSAVVLDEWNDMLRNAESSFVYHGPGFLRSWSQTLGADVEPLVGLCRHDSGHSVLLPWVVARYGGRFVERRVVEYAGRELSGYHEPLVVKSPGVSLDWEEFWQAAALATTTRCDQGRMRFVSRERAPRSAPPAAEASPVLDLSRAGSLDELLARCSSNHRGDVTRRLRRLRERGNVELRVASRSDYGEVASDVRSAFLVQHARVCAEKGYADPFGPPLGSKFVEVLFESGLAAGWAFYGRLCVDGESIAWILGLLHADEFYWWRPAYHLDWKDLSPGKVLLALTIEHGIGAGWKKIHFHEGEQRYKLAWKPDLPAMANVAWYAPSIRSSSLRWYDRVVGAH